MILDQCDREVFKTGIAVMVTHTISSNDVEAWVRKVAEYSGQKVDWHYMGGRAVIRAVGDIDAVDAVIQELLPEHDDLYKKASAAYDIGIVCEPPRWFPHKQNQGE